MPMNKQQIIDAAMSIASNMGTDAHDSPVVDNEMAAEDLLPLAFRHVYISMLQANPARRQDLLKEHIIDLTNGKGTFPVSIITEYIEESFLPEHRYSSYVQFMDFQRQKFENLICYWTENKGVFYTTCMGDNSDGSETSGSDSDENDGTIKLHGITMPSLPNDASTPVAIAERDLESLIYTLALAIRGELKLTIA